MTVPRDADGGGMSTAPSVDAGRLWAGGVATAIVAALVAVVGVLIARGLFDVPELASTKAGELAAGSVATYAGLAALAALLATGLAHLLLLSTPRPLQFFGWIMFLLIVAAALSPLLTDSSTSVKLATAAINLAIGVAIATLVSSMARSAVRSAARRAYPGPGQPPPYPPGAGGP